MLATLATAGRSLFTCGVHGSHLLMLPWVHAVNVLLAHLYRHRLQPSVHPSLASVDVRRACIRSVGALVCLPGHYDATGTTIGDVLALGAATQQHTMHILRALIYRTLTLSLANETDAHGVQLAAVHATAFVASTVAMAIEKRAEEGELCFVWR